MLLIFFRDRRKESKRNINVRNTNLLSLIPILMGDKTGYLVVYGIIVQPMEAPASITKF